MNEIRAQIRDLIIDNFLFGNDDGLIDNVSFLEKGIIDSTGILELVNFVEEKFKLAVEDEDLVPENFDSISSVTRYVEERITERSRAGQTDSYPKGEGN